MTICLHLHEINVSKWKSYILGSVLMVGTCIRGAAEVDGGVKLEIDAMSRVVITESKAACRKRDYIIIAGKKAKMETCPPGTHATTHWQDLVVDLVESLPSRRSGRSSGQSVSMVNLSRIKMKSDQLLKSSLTVSLRLLPPPEVLERRHINGQPSSLDLHSHKRDQD